MTSDMWDCNQATLDSSLSSPKNILKSLPSTFNSSTVKLVTLDTGGWFVIAWSICYLCEVWDLDVLHSITTKPCRIQGSVLDQPFCSDCACSFMGSSAWSQLRQESVPFLCISPAPAHKPPPCWGLPGASFSSQLNFSQHKTSEAFRPLIKPVCVWVQWAPQEPEAKQGSRWRWERGWDTQTPSHRIFSDLWSHAFCHPCSSVAFCPAELPGSASTSLPA